MNKKLGTLLVGLALCSLQGEARDTMSGSTTLAATLAQGKKTMPAAESIYSKSGFIGNAGQIKDQHDRLRSDIDFRIEGKGVNVFIGSGAIHYQWATPRKNRKQDDKEQQAQQAIDMYRMDVKLLGANSKAGVIREQKQVYFEQYLNGTSAQRAYTYNKVTYKEVYPHIDWVFYFNAGGSLEHDFIVHPGGKVSDIRLQYGGASSLKLGQNGDLVAKTPMGTVSETAPRSFTDKGSKVASAFVLDKDVLSFRTASYTGTLTIDPTLEWGTFYGGTSDDFSPDLANDPDGNIYMGFATRPGNASLNIVTTGAYQTTRMVAEGDESPFLVKFNSSGQRQWGTHFGRSATTLYPMATPKLSCDDYGHVFIMADTMFAKFNGAGELIWAKPIPGYWDMGYRSSAIQCDHSGNLYICGQSWNWINADYTTPGAYKTTITGDIDVFLMKYDSAGTRLWGTYFGGEGSEQNYAGYDPIACDAAGNVYLSGRTQSLTGIATPGSHQTTIGGDDDAFLAKFSPQGQLLWSTYYGGTNKEDGGSVSVDPDGNVYLAGMTTSTDGISTPNSFQDTLAGGNDFFLAKFNSSGVRQWGTYYGGEGEERYNFKGGILATDIFGNAILHGFTNSPDGISSPGAYQENIMVGSYTLFMAKLDPTGQRLWGTYFGGTGGSQIGGYIMFYGPGSAGGNISCDASGNIYIANSAGPNAVVTTPNGYQPLWSAGDPNAGMHDVFLSKFNDCAIRLPGGIKGDTLLCAGVTAARLYTQPATGAISYTWLLPSGWSGASNTDTIELTTNGGSGRVGIVATAACGGTDTVWQQVTTRPELNPVITNSNNTLSTGSFASYQWIRDGQAISGATSASYVATVSGSYTVNVTDAFGCTDTSAAVVVNTVGINGPHGAADEIQVYPNPSSKMVHISSPGKIRITLSSVDGRKLIDAKETSDIDISVYPEGMYLLQVTDMKGALLKTVKLTRTK